MNKKRTRRDLELCHVMTCVYFDVWLGRSDDRVEYRLWFLGSNAGPEDWLSRQHRRRYSHVACVWVCVCFHQHSSAHSVDAMIRSWYIYRHTDTANVRITCRCLRFEPTQSATYETRRDVDDPKKNDRVTNVFRWIFRSDSSLIHRNMCLVLWLVLVLWTYTECWSGWNCWSFSWWMQESFDRNDECCDGHLICSMITLVSIIAINCIEQHQNYEANENPSKCWWIFVKYCFFFYYIKLNFHCMWSSFSSTFPSNTKFYIFPIGACSTDVCVCATCVSFSQFRQSQRNAFAFISNAHGWHTFYWIRMRSNSQPGLRMYCTQIFATNWQIVVWLYYRTLTNRHRVITRKRDRV